MQEVPHKLFRRGNWIQTCTQFCHLSCVNGFHYLYAQVRSTEVVNGCREDVDTALLKLYAEQDHDSLLDLLASDNACVLADSVPWLEKYHKFVYSYDLIFYVNMIKNSETGPTQRDFIISKMLLIIASLINMHNDLKALVSSVCVCVCARVSAWFDCCINGD